MIQRDGTGREEEEGSGWDIVSNEDGKIFFFPIMCLTMWLYINEIINFG